MNLLQKLKETTLAIVPVMLIVLILHLTVTPLPAYILVSFFAGSLLVILGLGFFLTGVDLAIVPAGSMLGSALTRTRKLPLILLVILIVGFIITIAEPNLRVQGDLVQTVTGTIKSSSLIFSVALGIGLALSLAIARILFQIPYRIIVILSYGSALLLASRVSAVFVALAFDSSGAATGPLTVPFFIALGIGVASVRSDRTAEDDSFGSTGIAAIGPILAVIVLGFFRGDGNTLPLPVIAVAAVPQTLFAVYRAKILPILAEVALALGPLSLLLLVFQMTLLKLPPAQIRRIAMGMGYTFIGLSLFFLGAYTAFIPAGTEIGKGLGALSFNWILIPVGCLLGAVIVCAEPAIWVLTEQVEEVSGGNIRKPLLLAALAIGVSGAVGLSMWRVLAQFSIWYLLIPLFTLALSLSFFSPKLFTAIAFDSGGVATGPMSSTFILTLTIGASLSSGGNPATDAFGLIAMIAIAPPVSIQLLGFLFHRKELYMRKEAKIGI